MTEPATALVSKPLGRTLSMAAPDKARFAPSQREAGAGTLKDGGESPEDTGSSRRSKGSHRPQIILSHSLHLTCLQIVSNQRFLVTMLVAHIHYAAQLVLPMKARRQLAQSIALARLVELKV